MTGFLLLAGRDFESFFGASTSGFSIWTTFGSGFDSTGYKNGAISVVLGCIFVEIGQGGGVYSWLQVTGIRTARSRLSGRPDFTGLDDCAKAAQQLAVWFHGSPHWP